MTRRRFSRTIRALFALLLLPLAGCNLELMDPKGAIGAQEKSLILIALGLMLLVVIPVIMLTLAFAWRYRASNTKVTYAPDWAHSNAIEAVVWGIPILIILILAVIIWRSTHALDPFKPIKAEATPVRVEVAALNWKWLFLYPDYGIATVNKLEIPVNTPVDFRLTADSIMNDFFIPQLGSQIYAMAGMQSQLHLIADKTGTYPGRAVEFSGPGFSDMHFDTVVTSRQEFDDWLAKAKKSPLALDRSTYKVLASPSTKGAVTTYGNVTPGLFDRIVNQYMPAQASAALSTERTALCTAQKPAVE
jgi:cytochrome o ubiquinol oxidase subunit 2